MAAKKATAKKAPAAPPKPEPLPLLPVEGLSGPVPPGGQSVSGPYYNDQQQIMLGIDQYGLVRNDKVRAATSAPAKGKNMKKLASADKAQQWAKAVADTDANNALWREVVAGRKPRSALQYEDAGGQLRRVGYPEGYAPERPAPPAAPPGRRVAAPAAPAVPGAPVARGKGPVDAKAAERFLAGGRLVFKGRVKLLVGSNPKKGKAGERFALYREGMDIAEAMRLGITNSDIKRDLEYGFIKLE